MQALCLQPCALCLGPVLACALCLGPVLACALCLGPVLACALCLGPVLACARPAPHPASRTSLHSPNSPGPCTALLLFLLQAGYGPLVSRAPRLPGASYRDKLPGPGGGSGSGCMQWRTGMTELAHRELWHWCRAIGASTTDTWCLVWSVLLNVVARPVTRPGCTASLCIGSLQDLLWRACINGSCIHAATHHLGSALCTTASAPSAVPRIALITHVWQLRTSC